MYINFSALPPHSRIWIYHSDKILSVENKSTISQALKSFTGQWTVHGNPMEASFDIRFDRFIILGANDQASGCTIDHSVRTLKKIGETIGIDFFNRNLIFFQKEEEVFSIALNELKGKYQEGLWAGTSLVFNNLVSAKSDLESNWIVKASDSWLKRYLPQEIISQ